MLLMPNGAPSALIRETLSKDEVALVTAFERWCERRGLALDLICKSCLDAQRTGFRCAGNNGRDSSSYSITCDCRERKYGE